MGNMNPLTAIILVLLAPVLLGLVYGLCLRMGWDPMGVIDE